MSTKSERRDARDLVAGYHEARLVELVHHVGEAIDLYRAGELAVSDVDEVMFQYSRASKELWKFCNLGDFEVTARLIREGGAIDWWTRRAPKRR
jgi:hypothetical protein